MEDDRFASIAMGAREADPLLLQEITPQELPDVYLAPSDKIAEETPEIDYDTQLTEFHADIRVLREKFAPFMKNHTPAIPPEFERKQTQLKNFSFRFQEGDDQKDFSRVLEGRGDWEDVTIPDYRGPVGRWTGFYRTEFRYKLHDKKRLYLRFLGVDYIGNIYLNGRFVGSHEGFFSPFEFDITDFLRDKNILVVEVKNDAPTIGIDNDDNSPGPDGDKIYAATGPGWDDPVRGWHHCPPGAGIFNQVILEERPEIFINDIFVRPDIDDSSIEAWIEIYNTRFDESAFSLSFSIYPFNFKGNSTTDIKCEPEPPGKPLQPPGQPLQHAGVGVNYYKFKLPLENYRIWNIEEPWLYTLRIYLNVNEQETDIKDSRFGMRKFHMDRSTEPYGTLYLNNKEIFLRGANDMGHMQQCVMKDDYNQLIDDILIAKNANMNYFRFTQRPVQSEIYDYCDMLGMMNQTDLPIFGYLRRNQFAEAARQAGEMERLIRSHPSSIMVTYINEAFDVEEQNKGHRHLYKEELEDFFEAASKNVLLWNPDRVIKNTEGDYAPPTRDGLSDFHCYNMWYTNHALPIGKLHKGWLPAMRSSWKTGCGEYGTEGLDPLSVMLEDYPKDWVPNNLDDKWTPEFIRFAQSYSMHGDWYEEQDNIKGWISHSQKHQALATKMMTDAYRRRADHIVSTAVHLLIDAWPSGWMKTLVDHRRVPKPAYFELKKSYIPIRVHLRTDKFRVYTSDPDEIEVWVLNDTPDELLNYNITATVRQNDEVKCSYEITKNIRASSAYCAGILAFDAPKNAGLMYIDVRLADNDDRIINTERITIEVYEKPPVSDKTVLIIDNFDFHTKNIDEVLDKVRSGANAVFLMSSFEPGNIMIGETEVAIKPMNGIFFAARNKNDPLTSELPEDAFSFPYNNKLGYIGFVADKYIKCDGITPLFFTYEKPAFHESKRGEKRKLPVAGYLPYGSGRLYITTIPFEDISDPVFDEFLINLNG